MHSQVKSLLTEPLYLLALRLFDIFISNNTHRLLVVSTTSTRAVKVRPKWGINRPNFERCVHVEHEESTASSRSVFLDSMFPKTLKMHSQVKSLLTEPLYLLALRLFDIFISNNTHRLLVVSTTSTRAVKVRPKGGINRPNFERCVHIERPIFWKYVKKWNIYTNDSPVIWRKVVRGRRVTLPAESTLPSVRTIKKSCPVWQS